MQKNYLNLRGTTVYILKKMVPGRGDDYFQYENFLKILQELIDDQTDDKSYFYLIKDQFGNITGRINLVDLNWADRSAHVGYRVGEEYTGKGIAKQALSLLLQDVARPCLIQVFAKTTHNNMSSQKVLVHNQFKEIISISKEFDENGEDEFIHYVWKP